MLERWSQGGKAQVKSLGPWSPDRYGHFLAEAARADEALRDGRDVRVVLDEGVAPDTFKAAAEAYMAKNLSALRDQKHVRRWRKLRAATNRPFAYVHRV